MSLASEITKLSIMKLTLIAISLQAFNFKIKTILDVSDEVLRINLGISSRRDT